MPGIKCCSFILCLSNKKKPFDVVATPRNLSAQARSHGCPDVSDEAKKKLAAAAAPPMRKIVFGKGDNQVQIGQVTVCFRHEEKFHSPALIAVTVSDKLNEKTVADAMAKYGLENMVKHCKLIIPGYVAVLNSKRQAQYLLCIAEEPTPIGRVTDRRIFELSKKLPIIVRKTGIIWNKTTEMKITAEDFLHQENDGTSGRTEINEKQRSEKIRNEERTAPIEVEILGCIPYDNNVSAGSAKGENIFELDSENPAFMEVAKIMQNRLDIAR